MYRYRICFLTNPLLGHRNRYLTGNCIRNCETCLRCTGDSSCISLYGNFLHRILDFMSICLVILIQIFKFTLPLICCIQCERIFLFTINQQFHFYLRSFFSNPLLFDRNRHRLRICIRNCETCLCCTGDNACISGYRNFLHCILNFMTIRFIKLVEIVELTLPLICCIQCKCLFLFTICQQFNLYLRSFFSNPLLFDRNGYCLSCLKLCNIGLFMILLVRRILLRHKCRCVGNDRLPSITQLVPSNKFISFVFFRY